MLAKYANLLIHYCLELKAGEKLFITTTTLAEPLVREVYRIALQVGAFVEVQFQFREQNRLLLLHGNDAQLSHLSPLQVEAMNHYDAYLHIRAPYNLKEDMGIDQSRQNFRQTQLGPINQVYFNRLADKSLKRCLCQYPTLANAQEAEMSLEEYENFVFNACHLFNTNPADAWLKVRQDQQKIVDYLNKSKEIRYKNLKTDITFSVDQRIWINSDGRSNMPSGEVFTSPIENSVQGTVHFDYPSIYMGNEVGGITLEVKDGYILNWKAERGQQILDKIFEIPGARYFGEVAIGTNYNIQKPTKNILFDEKIGGTIHMAIGQSYLQTGGTNESAIHWDMIADMKQDSQIFADGKLIYTDGNFVI